MLNWLTKTFVGKFIATFFISMLPVVELRGGIPYGVGFGLNPWVAYIAALLGNMLPVPFILLLADVIFEWMKTKEGFLRNIALKLETKAISKKESIERYKLFGLLIFVAIPLPGTGAWTGAMAAAVLRMNRKHAFWSIFGGVVIAGIIVLILSYGVASLFRL